MKTKLFLSLSILIALLSSCGASRKTATTVERPAPINLSLKMIREPRANSFIDIDYGIRIQTYDARAKKGVMSKYDANPIFVPTVTSYPAPMDFIRESCKKYMTTLGFSINADVETDYWMSIKLTEMNLSYLSHSGWIADVSIDVEIMDSDRRVVYPSVPVTGRSNSYSDAKDYAAANTAMNEAYANAFDDIDWARIAYFLKKADKASAEKNKKVEGKGNTALESTVINWYVESSPKGADVNWRVVSSTPDVKNTNSKYLGSTPYESTETFDIMGLTYNNSGNVQIEVTCEKAGYITQKKRFNLRSVIDQKEVSTKFNLVKEE